ncbi:outer membrane beta-barrel family protein [Sediminitomix flava]|uniref:TonB-dependent receptor-like protein n=1 Tax=Sediminitomix flava TaxID=379075 RepID=A0A315Z9F3_SEDFL|nr:outer membrane beta-barrel family protein [Sediminitomix flava]PWJ42040.1 TonB-dependent receptor-like protein [Sediminitomix flava]
MKLQLILLSFFLAFTQFAFAQGPRAGGMPPMSNGTIFGKVVEEDGTTPIEFASVVLHQSSDDKVIGGGITNEKGFFRISKIDEGNYYIQVKFMGYETTRIDSFDMGTEAKRVGKIVLKSSATELEEVSVSADRPKVEYNIDRKVINVSNLATAMSGTAVEVLENLPSIQVDAEGEVSLRGSSDFTVFIDGRPSVFSGSDALKQLPASSIASIEVITNPSAKYDPDGTSGIINIITKKKMGGFSGVANVHGGNQGRYGSDALFSYKTGKFNFYLGGDYNNYGRNGTSTNITNTYRGDTTFVQSAKGDAGRAFTPYNIKAGFDFDATKNDLFTLMFSKGQWGMNRTEESDFIDEEIINGVPSFSNSFFSDELFEIKNNYYTADLDYVHKFKDKKGHELSFGAYFRTSEKDESTENIFENSDGSYYKEGQYGTEYDKDKSLRLKLDYILPLGDNKFEAGYQARLERAEGYNELFLKDGSDGEWVLQDEFSFNNTYSRDIHSAYGIFSGKKNKLGYQFGLRAEYTDRQIKILELPEDDSHINRIDLFPTVHFSYQLPKEQQLMASYGRKINRPRSWYLEPFLTYSDAFNVRRGNPDLLPEFIDSYELGYQKNIKNATLSVEGYYRIEHNNIQRITLVYEEDPSKRISYPINVGTESTGGVEIMYSTPIVKWWHMNLATNLFSYSIEGKIEEQDISRSSFNWTANISNDLKLGKIGRLQISSRYYSPTVTAQGEREDMVSLDLGYRQQFMDGKFSLNVMARNILGTMNREQYTYGPDFDSYRNFEMLPSYSVSLSYRINNYKPKRGKRPSGSGGGGMEGDF